MKSYNFYTSKEIKPRGWMKRQLEIQAKGLCGNLDKVWRDVRDSAWIGGDAEGWERVPYWLDGFITLAYLLENEDMITRAKGYIDAIISAQQPDGWICPCNPEERKGYGTWAVLLISKVLTVYYECSGDGRIPTVIYKTLKNYHSLLKSGEIELFDWGKFRWFEGFISINFLYGIYKEEWIRDLAKILKAQGTNYFEHTEAWKKPLNKWTYHTHIVNMAMMLKQEAVSCGILGDTYTDKAETLREILAEYNGTVTELFTGDEVLSGLSPIRGTELCAVVEQMYSYELLYAYTGNKKWAERLEVIAFNALPAAISDDGWAHQYDQMSNQIQCSRFPGKAIFRTNGADAHIFGLEPEYGCCTANYGQGWPKLALSAFMYNGNRIINGFPIPAELKTEDVFIRLETEYPFKNRFKYTIETKRDFEFAVRIPSFADRLSVNGEARERCEELVFEIKENTASVITISFDSTPLFIDRPYNLKAVKMGSLIFSLPIEYEKVMLEYTKNNIERKYPYCDYEYIGKSDWNYAYSDRNLKAEEREVDWVPFSSVNPPVVIKAKAKRIDWGLEDGYEFVCAKMPESTAPISDEEEITLYPYGCAKLRMTEIPLIEE